MPRPGRDQSWQPHPFPARIQSNGSRWGRRNGGEREREGGREEGGREEEQQQEGVCRGRQGQVFHLILSALAEGSPGLFGLHSSGKASSCRACGCLDTARLCLPPCSCWLRSGGLVPVVWAEYHCRDPFLAGMSL